ncbi:transport of long-chain fatty acid [Acinetobacter variabilis]|uniref:outer membrane protein transport protein n=1 Tax=Acinetobacter variabilis TaxID=70346 RepID=UPI0021D216F1|nr:outer membrane protein transport protein [Acinetobacter variabilis]MCU4630363.1 transport of long-chain fatty acid [Acinetobacter variabilis]
MMSYKFSLLGCGLIFSGTSFAAAFEQSNQTIQFFFEKEHYAEVSFAWTNPNVSGQVQHTEILEQLGIQDFSTGQLANNQLVINAALKLQLHPQISWGFIYDQPFYVDVAYEYSPVFVGEPTEIEAADIKFDSHNLTSILGYQPDPNWNLYAGLSYQTLEGNLSLVGESFSVFNGYHVQLEQNADWGWLAGISYQIPEYFFRSSLTYRSAINHQLQTTESLIVGTTTPSFTKIQTPQSINLDIQTGLPSQNIFYAGLRWVNWQDFVIQPPKFGTVIDYAALEFPEVKDIKMIDYQEDQWSAKLGIAHQWPSSMINSFEILWDSGTGNPASTLNPSDGYWGVGLGYFQNFQKHWDIATGLYYLKFQKPKTDTNASIPQFVGLSAVDDNDVWVVGMKLGYHFQ